MSPRFSDEFNQTVLSFTADQLGAQGVPRKAIRTGAWRRTSHGQFAAFRPGPLSTTQRIVDAVPLIPPTGALAGWAAAFVRGADVFDGLHPHTLRELPVQIALGSTVGRGQHHSVRYSRDRIGAGDIEVVEGVRVTSAARTAFDLARWASDPCEAVVAVDAVQQYGLVSPAELQAYVDARRGWNGLPRVKTALKLTVPGVRSPWESRLRYVYEVDGGLPRPLVNPLLWDLDGTFLGMPDLFDPEAAFGTEYDGAQHRERQQHSDDNVREERFEGANLTVARADSLMMRTDKPALIARLHAGHRRGLRRDRRLDRWTLRD